ncbi:hypothetical protein BJ165DRAFT_1101167 [Panaeolus papilionaceus]|nr:hypothetical protein BJ165DRAFT_1101167 [Panaeolus papilionaceus]
MNLAFLRSFDVQDLRPVQQVLTAHPRKSPGRALDLSTDVDRSGQLLTIFCKTPDTFEESNLVPPIIACSQMPLVGDSKITQAGGCPTDRPTAFTGDHIFTTDNHPPSLVYFCLITPASSALFGSSTTAIRASRQLGESRSTNSRPYISFCAIR